MFETSVTLPAVRRRVMVLFFAIILAVAGLIGRLAWLQIVRSEKLYDGAWEQWNRSIPARSPRGSIYDREGRILAGSVTVDTITAIPAQVEDPPGAAKKLAPLLGMSESKLLERLTMERSSIYLKRKVPPEISKAVRKLGLPGIIFTPEGQRYYPNGTLASQVLGFVGMDEGLAGLESHYETQLQGKEGYLLFPSDNLGRQIPHEVKRFVPPKEGADLHLTIDETIQYIVERELARAMIEFQPKQALAIAANPVTGEILAAASKPDYDPADYEAGAEYWDLPPVNGSFEPGSTFKLVTLCAAVEEGLYNEKEHFYCRGSVNVGGHNIRCWTGSGHGSITFLEAVESSCNPAFIKLGERLGAEKLFGYIRAFGCGEQSGIDYPGESEGLVFEPGQVGPVELATSSFGQGLSVTPLQQLMVVSAIANGGDLMKPYLVKEISNSEGKPLYEREPEVVRQVVSRTTADKVTWLMENVTLHGSAMNAAIEGYRIAAKTGTAEKVGPTGSYIPGEYIVSLIGFVPAEDPQIALYVSVDGAARGVQWGSQIGAPIFKRIMTDVLNYLQVPSSKGRESPEIKPVKVPDLRGLSADEAAAKLETAGLMLRLIGEGQHIVNQTPKSGATVPRQTQIVVYLSDTEEENSGEIKLPDLRGFTMKETGEVLTWLGLHLQAEGSGIAVEQNPDAGTPVEPGGAVKVFFEAPVER